MPRDFRKIKAWQFADDLAVAIYKETKSFPKEELYGITSQIKRAAVSVPTNIVEGAARNHKKEYLQFLCISKGSLAETEYLLHLSKRLGFVNDSNYLKIEDLIKETAKTLTGLIKSVESEV